MQRADYITHRDVMELLDQIFVSAVENARWNAFVGKINFFEMLDLSGRREDIGWLVGGHCC